MKKKKIIIYCQSCNKKMKLLPCQSHKKTCGNKLCYSRYMSNKMIKVKNIKHIKKKCLNCTKILDLTPSMKKKYCSVKCKHKWLQKNKKGIWNPEVNKRAAYLGGIQSNIINKKNRTGIYGIPKYKRQEYAKRASPQSKITNEKNKTGLFDPKVRAMGRAKGLKKGQKANFDKHYKNKTGLWSQESHKKSLETLRRKKIGCYHNKKLQIENGKKGGKKTVETLRNKSKYIYKKIHFSSKGELEIALCLEQQFNIKIKEKINYQIQISSKTFDFLINKCFIEYHPIIPFFTIETGKEYYNKRRQVLNQNGYKNYNLVVIP